MSALLNHNERVLISWKGRTLNQITSSIQKNGEINGKISGDNIFRALPLKIYRREIAANIANRNICSNSRYSSSIDVFDQPGGSIILNNNEPTQNTFGQFNTMETPATGNLNETYGCNGANGSSLSSYNCAEQNARRRCRSSGIIKRVYDPVRSEIAYFTNTNQYLVSRSKTFLQNQYRHIRPNDISIMTNPMKSKEIYSPNGISHCPKVHIVDGANVFYYYWIDASGGNGDFSTIPPATPPIGKANWYTVTIPPGYYDVHSLNMEFETAMFENTHYFIYKPTHSNYFLMKFIYNNTNNCVEIQTFSTASIPANLYELPINCSWSRPAVDVVPVYYIPSDLSISPIIGFSSGFYPDVAANPNANRTLNGTAYGALSNIPHTIYPSYSITYYKPSNNRFATQGGVSSSDMTQRIKYETISRNGLLYSRTLGSEVGSAMSYGVSEHVYTLKDKIGYPLTKTPVIDKYTGAMKCLANARRSGYCASAPNG
jgi:hypothetical protein